MSEVAVAPVPEAVTLPDSETVTPDRGSVPEPSPVEEAVPDTSPSETHGTETPEAPTPELPAATPEARLGQLDAKIERGEDLSAAEAKEYRSATTSVAARRAANEQAIAAARQRAEQKQQAVKDLYPALDAELANIWGNVDGTPSSIELAKERQRGLLTRSRDVLEPVFTQPVHDYHDKELIAIRGDNPELRRWLEAASWEQKAAQLKADISSIERGKGPDADHEVIPKKGKGSRADIEAAAVSKALDDFKAKNPGMASVTNGARANGNGSLTYERWRAMTATERRDVKPEDEQRMMAELQRSRRA